MRKIKFKEVIKMKDLQAPYITDAEIYGADSGQSADVPLDEMCIRDRIVESGKGFVGIEVFGLAHIM